MTEQGDNLGWGVRVMSPADLSAGMNRRYPYNLNAQSHDATIGLISDVIKSGMNVTEVSRVDQVSRRWIPGADQALI